MYSNSALTLGLLINHLPPWEMFHIFYIFFFRKLVRVSNFLSPDFFNYELTHDSVIKKNVLVLSCCHYSCADEENSVGVGGVLKKVFSHQSISRGAVQMLYMNMAESLRRRRLQYIRNLLIHTIRFEWI